ncbi:MAG: ABC transporter substrate-binding protein [Actinobacteria bacterium]|nr:ABC transporter substrate-binding protein [Actinomycetota bacterium]
MKKTLITRRVAILAAASLSFLAACGGSGTSSDTTVAASAGNGKKILSLSPTATEMLYAIGAGDQVVAVDSLSNYPAEAADKLTKISAFEPNAEAILGYNPDIVLISNDMNKITEQLKTAKPDITVWTGAMATTIDDVYAQITDLGVVTGHDVEAAALVTKMKADLATATDGVTAPEGASYYYELDNTYYSLTSNTFVGSLLKSTGITNIADGVEAGNDWPQLNAESIIKANPTVIFLADTKCCQQDAAAVAKRAGWDGIDAVKNARVVELDDDIASRWGPRIVDLVKQMVESIKSLQK